MQLAEELTKLFDGFTRWKGHDYFVDGRVELRELKPGRIGFNVYGRKAYDVLIRFEPHSKTFPLHCTCAQFEAGNECKHLWASILATDDMQLLKELTRVNAEPQKPEPTARWQDILRQAQQKQQLRLQHENPHSGDGAKTANLRAGLYAVDVGHSATRGQVQLQLFVHELRKKGGFGSQKPAELTAEKIVLYEDAREREFLWDLLGRTESVSPYEGFRSSGARVNHLLLRPGQADAILRKISETGKLYRLRQSERRAYGIHDKPELVPYIYDVTKWMFRLRLSKTNTGFALQGELISQTGDSSAQRGMEQVLAMAENFVFFTDSMARSDLKLHGLWFELVKSGPVEMNDHEVEAFLDYFWNQARARLPLELPTELKWNERRDVQPQPRLLFALNKNSGAVTVRLAFGYGTKGGEKVAELGSGRYVYNVADKEKILRDLDFETKCLHQLEAWNPNPAEDPSVQGAFSNTEFVNVVEKALALDWAVFAEDQRLQMGGQIHIEVVSGVDWFDVDGEVKFKDQVVALPQLIQALRAGRRLIPLSNGMSGVLPESWLQRFAPLFELGAFSEKGLRLNKVQMLFMNARLQDTSEILLGGDRKFQNLHHLLQELNEMQPKAPGPEFKAVLRHYQQMGFAWMQILAGHGIGGILADDMGLGKTIQVLALISQMRQAGKPSLVLAPKSLVFNWQSEAEKFSPELKVLIYAGTGRRSQLADLAKYDVIITTYQTLRIDVELLQKQKFDFLILDEAHILKNSHSQMNMAAKLILADKKFALTGTPVENSLMDLFSILSIVNPGLMTKAQATRWTKVDDSEKLQGLIQALQPFLLRRTKAQVLSDLPEKTEQILYCELSDKERSKYDELKAYYWAQLKGVIEDKGLARSKIDVLEALLRLRQAACHQGLLDHKLEDGVSTKFDLVLEQLENVLSEGHKALVFSQFTTLLELFARRLQSSGIRYEYLDGQTNDRADRVAHFQQNKDCQIFLLSLKAGGVGLNLTAADYVFILDPWWNPAAEAQAVDRTHRIGQTKKVFAYKVIAQNTVEEKILALQEKKRKLAQAVISDDANLLKNMTLSDLRELFI